MITLTKITYKDRNGHTEIVPESEDSEWESIDSAVAALEKAFSRVASHNHDESTGVLAVEFEKDPE